MRQAEREIKDRSAIDDLIKRAVVCRLGMIDGDEPYIVPMNFGYDGKSLFFHCAKEGRKIDILRRHDKVCFEIDLDTEVVKGDVACKWSMRYRSVEGVGTGTSGRRRRRKETRAEPDNVPLRQRSFRVRGTGFRSGPRHPGGHREHIGKKVTALT